MAFLRLSKTLSILFLLTQTSALNFIPTIEARTSQSTLFQLTLTKPIHIASFAFTFIFILAFTVITLSALGKLGNTNKLLPAGHRYPLYYTGSLYPFLISLAPLFLVIFYVLYAVTIVYTLNDSKQDLRPISLSFVSGRSVMVRLAQWVILCALLVLLFQREKVERDKEATRQWYLYKLGLDCVLLVTLMGIIIASNVLHGIFGQLHPEQEVDMIHLDFAYITFQAILTLDVIISSLWTWFKLKNKSEPDKVCFSDAPGYLLTPTLHFPNRS